MLDDTRAFLADAGLSAAVVDRSRLLRLILAGAGALAAAAAVWAWFFWPLPLTTVRPRLGTAIAAVYASGNVESAVMLPVAPRIGGRLVSLASDEQHKVAKGQVLARLEAEDLAGNISQLEAQATFARNDYQRYARLMAQDATARQTYEHALAAWQAAEAAVRQARAQAGFMTLTAPAACQVISRDGEVGQFIAANTPIFWLACDSGLRISAQVDEEDIRLVRPGQRVVIRADAFPGQVFEGRVSEVTPKGDPIGRSYRVRIALPADTPLRIGMTADTNIVIRQSNAALLLPAASVADGNVWLVTDGKAVRRPVLTGARNGDQVEILQGLSRNDAVLPDGRSSPSFRGLRNLPGLP